jgi:hypothetical protein
MTIEKANAFDSASSAVRKLNRLPAPSVDDKLETMSRVRYVDGILVPNAFNLINAFRILAKSDVAFSASIAQEIQSKSWRLATDVVIETERIYPLPEQSKTSKASPTPR